MRGRGLKLGSIFGSPRWPIAPQTGAWGLKQCYLSACRPPAGAWVETLFLAQGLVFDRVAPPCGDVG